jgi:hypothetical protein
VLLLFVVVVVVVVVEIVVVVVVVVVVAVVVVAVVGGGGVVVVVLVLVAFSCSSSVSFSPHSRGAVRVSSVLSARHIHQVSGLVEQPEGQADIRYLLRAGTSGMRECRVDSFCFFFVLKFAV